MFVFFDNKSIFLIELIVLLTIKNSQSKPLQGHNYAI